MFKSPSTLIGGRAFFRYFQQEGREMNIKSMEDTEPREFMGDKWQQNGITNKEVSKAFFSDCGEVVKISDAAGSEWVKLNPVGIPEQLIKGFFFFFFIYFQQEG